MATVQMSDLSQSRIRPRPKTRMEEPTRIKSWSPALQCFLAVAALAVVGMLIWQGFTADGTPDPLR